MQKNKVSRNLICAFLISAFSVSCAQLQTARSTSKSASVKAGGTQAKVTGSPAQDRVGEGFQDAPVAMNNQQIPKVGLILGPGMGMTMAHAGVLNELEKRKIPVDAVVGLGWGAVVGALYAKESKVHEVSWRLYKFKKSDLPTSSFFSKDIKVASVESLNGFLKDGFKNVEVDSFSTPFSCPSSVLGSGKVIFNTSGRADNVLKRCLAYPPFYEPMAGKLVSAPGAVFRAIDWLKQRNIDVIILVDVLPSSQSLLPKGKVDFRDVVLWGEVREQLKLARRHVDEVIEVNTKGRKVTDFDGRKSLVRNGERAGKKAAERIAEKFGF